MKVVLLERVEKLGKMGDVVSVKDGFGRNFLLPQKKALRATPENISHFEGQRAVLEAQSKDLQVRAEGFAKKISGTVLFMVRQASESGHLYGSVNSRDVARALAEKNIAVSHAQVHIDTPIKTVGVYDLRIALHPEVSTFVKVSVALSEEEAKARLETPEGVFKKSNVRDASLKEDSLSSTDQGASLPEEMTQAD